MVTVKTEELLAFDVDLFPGTNVDEKRCCHCHPVSIRTVTPATSISLDSPYGSIKRGYAYHIEILRDPTPDGGVTIDTIAPRTHNEEKGKGRNEWQSIASQEVPLLDGSDFFCVIFTEECQIDVASHRKCPVRISTYKPVGHIRAFKVSGKEMFYIWMRKACTWHNAPPVSPSADRPISVAMLVMIFPHDA